MSDKRGQKTAAEAHAELVAAHAYAVARWQHDLLAEAKAATALLGNIMQLLQERLPSPAAGKTDPRD